MAERSKAPQCESARGVKARTFAPTWRRATSLSLPFATLPAQMPIFVDDP
jgi:hypothetical protein